MKFIKNLPVNYKIFAVIAIVSILGIILRWEYIKHEATKSFRYFGRENSADTLKNK